MSFHALDVALEIVREMKKPLEVIAKRDRDLAKQIRRAVTSVPLNLGEGSGRYGADARYHYRVARGSCVETTAGLDTAVALGYVDEASLARLRELLDRERAMLWRLAA